MSEIDAIRQAARERGRQLNLPYAGALRPHEAYRLMQAGGRLVDVRTQAELYWIGQVPGSVWVEWNSYPGGVRNSDFVSQLAALTDKTDTLLFLCRSGGRSHFAASVATEAGWPDCYNVLEGFEGDRDPGQHRGSVNGWKVAGLPWVQG
ncbi:MAG: rhodanese-like domain-containing protein [Betaproteobacteria bacterium]|nr:MAG: rhodanese-like domain-containing protein [Betaproteobacteria bacterium]